ncbi:MAG: hypothetical protein ABFD11_13615 [Christensenella sp.]
MRKLIPILLVIVLAFSLFACKTQTTETSEQSATAEAAEAPVEETVSPEPAGVDPNTVIEFNDDVLESMIRSAMNKPEGDILVSDALAMTELTLEIDGGDWSLPRIHDLSALQYFTNLTSLTLGWAVQNADYYDNDVDISVLAGMTKMLNLQLKGIRVTDISAVGNMPELLDFMVIGNSRLTDISPLANCKKLSSLIADGCGIIDVSPLENLTELTRLILTNNMISDVTPLKGLSKLSILTLAGNPIKDFLSLGGNYKFFQECDFTLEGGPQPIVFHDAVLEQKVRAALNKPEGDITLADTEGVTELWIGNEWREEIPDDQQIRDITDLKYFPNLVKLSLSNHNVARLDVLRVMPNLQDIYLENNDIRDLRPLLACKSLYWLNLNGCQCTNVDLAPLAQMTQLLSLNISTSPNITDISVVANLINLQALYLQNMMVDLTPIAGLANLKTLYVMEPIEGKYTPDYSPLAGIYPNLTDKNFTLPNN